MDGLSRSAKRIVKRQLDAAGCAPTPPSAHPVLNDELADVFRRWYPEFDRRGNEEELAA
jgi:hypothetical protein